MQQKPDKPSSTKHIQRTHTSDKTKIAYQRSDAPPKTKTMSAHARTRTDRSRATRTRRSQHNDNQTQHAQQHSDSARTTHSRKGMRKTNQGEHAQTQTDIPRATTNRENTQQTNQTRRMEGKLYRRRTSACSHDMTGDILKTPYPPEDTAAEDGYFPEDKAEAVRNGCTLNAYYCCGDCR